MEGQLNPCKLFVGQVPSTCSEETLRSIFDIYGEVTEVAILKNRQNGLHRGCAFVIYALKEDAQNAIEALNGKMILDGAKREMIVSIAASRKQVEEKECKVYVGMLSPKTTEDEIREMFSTYGEVIEVHVMRHHDGTPKGSAFVKYATRAEGQGAIDDLHNKMKDKDMPKLLQVRYAFTPQEKFENNKRKAGMFGMNAFPSPQGFSPGFNHHGVSPQLFHQGGAFGQIPYSPASMPYLLNSNQGINRMSRTHPFPPKFGPHSSGREFGLGLSPYAMQQHHQLQTQQIMQDRRKQNTRGPAGANIFVFGIPESYSDEDLGSLFSNFGTVLSSNVQSNEMGKSKGFGFVSFSEKKAAETAIHAMNGFVIGSKRLEVRLKKGEDSSHKPY